MLILQFEYQYPMNRIFVAALINTHRDSLYGHWSYGGSGFKLQQVLWLIEIGQFISACE